jgi:hypothetical protein
MHRRHLHANILAEHENTAAGRTPGIHRSNVMATKTDTNSLAYKTPKANIGMLLIIMMMHMLLHAN